MIFQENLMFVYSLYVMLRFEIFNLLAFTLLELGLLPTWWYVDDGCNTESDDSPVDFTGSYQPNSFQAGVRCCSTDGSQCTTLGTCPGGTTYSDAAEKCADDGKRLCTKDELRSEICCFTGGNCDSSEIWTSTPSGSGNVLQDIFVLMNHNH